MTNTNLPDEVLKADVRGRVRPTPQRREALLDEFERAGVSGQRFAALVGVNYQTFASWVQKRRKVRGQHPLAAGQARGMGPAAAGTLRWVEAVVENGAVGSREAEGASLWVHLPGGARMEIGGGREAALAAQVLRALAASAEARPC